MMDYEQMYADLSQRELNSVATRAGISVDDVRQEARLLCWKIASGQSSFDSRLGTTRCYIMARLWGLAKREMCEPGSNGNDDGLFEAAGGGDPQGSQILSWYPSVLDHLINRDDRAVLEAALEAEERRLAGAALHLSWVERAHLLGVSHAQMASLTGVTRQAIGGRRASKKVRAVGSDLLSTELP